MDSEFSYLGLDEALVQAVTEHGFVSPTPIQEAVIPLMICGQDVVGQAQTGTGKTAAFALPMLHNFEPGFSGVQGLVLAPTRELALQVSQACTAYGRHSGARVLAVYGGTAYGPQIYGLRRGVDIVVGTPGRILDLIEKKELDLSQVRTVVLDEADEMLSMGFLDDIQSILDHTPENRQTALFSATLPAEIRDLAERYLHNPVPVTIQGKQVTLEAIEQRAYLVHAVDKTAALTRLFEVEDISRALIFVRTRGESGDVANELTVRGFPAEALNGDLTQEARERTLNRFRQDQLKVLVATDVAARGLDIDDISHVFNLNLPDDPELYVHRIGRTGRAGKSGIAISLVSPAERRRLRQVEAFTRQRLKFFNLPTEEDIRNHREARLVEQVVVWLVRGRCKQEREIVERLVQEGHDPLAVAAAALKVARADEKQRPIAPLSPSRPAEEAQMRGERRRGERPGDISQERPGGRSGERSHGERPRRERGGDRAWSSASHEPGMVRLSMKIGRTHGLRPNDIVGAIAAHAEIPGSAIGKIHIQENTSSVDVPEELVGQVLAKTRKARLCRLPLDLERTTA